MYCVSTYASYLPDGIKNLSGIYEYVSAYNFSFPSREVSTKPCFVMKQSFIKHIPCEAGASQGEKLRFIVLFVLIQKEPKKSRPDKNLLKITTKIALEVNSPSLTLGSNRLLACNYSRDFLHANF
ncbi:MAG: hypothetical protein JSS63_08245 [Bacteroidetes bacterium]|nr:hypothetical protein [Bacteroidota bacterium]